MNDPFQFPQPQIGLEAINPANDRAIQLPQPSLGVQAICEPKDPAIQLPQPELGLPTTPPQAKAIPESVKYKNQLQEIAQKAGIPLPVYKVNNEGLCHLPCFRATVEVNGYHYTTAITFQHRKEAEQEAAKIALENLGDKIKEPQDQWSQELACSFIVKVPMFSKSILNEFVAKENLPMPVYVTTRGAEQPPYFASCVIFDGRTYPREVAKSKKEAEQLAASAAIRSLFGDNKRESTLLATIKSKAKSYEATIGIAGASNGTSPCIQRECATTQASAAPHSCIGNPPSHLSCVTPQVNLPISFVPASSGQSINGSSSKKRRKNRRKPNKKARVDVRLPGDAALPSTQAPSQLAAC